MQRLYSFLFVGLLHCQLAFAGSDAINTPEQAITALVEIYRKDTTLRARFPKWIGPELTTHGMRATKVPDEMWGSARERTVKAGKSDTSVSYYSPEAAANATSVWSVRVKENGDQLRRFNATLDANTGTVIEVRNEPPLYR